MVFTQGPSAHLGSLATGLSLGTISASSGISRFVQGGVAKTFRCVTQIARMLDVHISNSPDDASRVEPTCSIAFDVHRTLFANLRDSNCPLLQRMGDFYSDCTYSGTEITLLASEIDLLLPGLDQRTSHFSALQALRIACDTASDRQHSLFVFCD